MSIVPRGQGMVYVIGLLPKWLIALLATAGFPFFILVMKDWSQENWMQGPGMITLAPLILSIMALIMVEGLWVAAWIDHKEGKSRQIKGGEDES